MPDRGAADRRSGARTSQERAPLAPCFSREGGVPRTSPMCSWGSERGSSRWQSETRICPPTLPRWSVLGGDAERVDGRVYLHGGEGGFRRNVIGESDCVVTA